MKTTLIILWCLIGAISVWRTYYGMQKEWYEMFGKTMDEDHCKSHKMLLGAGPLLMLGGLVFYIIVVTSFSQAWYFKTPKKDGK
jgi:uncharacterized membrane protein